MSLEFFIKLREMVSGGLVKMASTAKRTADSIKGANGTLSQSYDEIRNKINQLESAIGKSKSVAYIREARRELTALQQQAKFAPGNMGGGGGLIRSLLPGLGIAAALAMGGSALQGGLQAQARKASFEVMAGKSEGNALNQGLTKFAQDSIYGNELYQNAQTMLAFGASAKEVLPDLKMLGDIAMGNKERLGSLTLAFSQARAAGKLTGQDLLQFVNAGFNPLQIMAEKSGKSLNVLREEMSKGMISFDMVKSAFESATGAGGKFYNMTNIIAKTDYGKIQAFWGQFDGLMTKIGGAIAPVAGSLASFASSLIDAEPSAIAMASAIGVMAVALNWTSIALGFAAAKQWLLNIAMSANPIGLIIAAIAALVVGVIYAWRNFEGFRGVLYGVWEVGKMIADVYIGLGKILVGALTMDPNLIKSGFMQSANAISEIASGGIVKRFNLGYGKGVASMAESNAATPSTSNVSDSFAASKPSSVSATESDTAKGITGGGPRVINIHINKMVEKIEVHAASVKEGMAQIQDDVEETLLRLLHSGASTQ
jgi:tape measure domain-containing protein